MMSQHINNPVCFVGRVDKVGVDANSTKSKSQKGFLTAVS